jgi:CRP-like cAMP-binding protein
MLDLLQSVEMFEGLDERQLKRLAELFREQTLGAGETLFSRGDEATRLFLVKEGFLEVVVPGGEDGEERTIVHLGHGQSVGEMSLVERGTRSATIRALTPNTVVASASIQAIKRLCERCPKLGHRILSNIAADLSFRLRRHTEES